MYILSTIWNILNTPFFGAFFGACFALLFGIIAYEYTKRREKWKIHNDAVVKAESLVNRHLNQISDNKYLLKGALEIYKKGFFSENVLTILENPVLSLDFHNLEIINNYLDYQSLVEKSNHDLEAWNHSNDRLFNAALSGVVPAKDINANRENIADKTKQTMNHLDDLISETYTFGAYVREFLKVDKRPRFALLKFTGKISISDELVAKEREKLVDESKKRSKEDYEKRLKKYQSNNDR